MRLPVLPPIEPMLAKPSDGLPTGDGWLYEPKWDGFRAMVFRDGDEIYTQSRDLKPLDRYFPELADPLRANIPERCVLDGEIVISRDGALQFELLLLRIHPAASRVKMLAEESPASFVAWDLLALGDEDLRDTPQGERRARLEAVLGSARPPIHLTPATLDRDTAADWFDRFEGAGLDGVVAKRLDAPYQPGKRAMFKIKHQRTADCAVAGFRWHKNGPGTHVGSLLLGLFDDDGTLHHVGVTSSFTWDKREALAAELAPLRDDALTEPSVEGLGRMVRLSGRPTPRASGCPGRPRAGTAARTSRGSRSASSASPRSPTTTSRATGSGTARRSSAGARTRRPPTAATTSSRRRPPTRSRGSSAREGRHGPRRDRGDRVGGGPGRGLLPRRARAHRGAGGPAVESAPDPGRARPRGVARPARTGRGDHRDHRRCRVVLPVGGRRGERRSSTSIPEWSWIGLSAVWWLALGVALWPSHRALGAFTFIVGIAALGDVAVTLPETAGVVVPWEVYGTVGGAKLPLAMLWAFVIGVAMVVGAVGRLPSEDAGTESALAPGSAA